VNQIPVASRKTRRLYALAAVLAAGAASLQLAERDWFRAVTGFTIAATMVLAATGYPERSEANRRVYFGLLGIVVVMLIVQISRRLI
jgi:hypothetical protein